MVEIGAELPKLPPNITGYPVFWTTLYKYIGRHVMDILWNVCWQRHS